MNETKQELRDRVAELTQAVNDLKKERKESFTIELTSEQLTLLMDTLFRAKGDVREAVAYCDEEPYLEGYCSVALLQSASRFNSLTRSICVQTSTEWSFENETQTWVID